jgi:CHASE2 domain-containing sensor protein
MVRERLGDWRLAWRFALAGLLAGLLVVVLSTRGVMSGPFFAAQDQLFPAPAPDRSVTFIALDQPSLIAVGTLTNADHARVIDYLSSLHPAVILFDFPLGPTASDPELSTPGHPFDTNKPLTAAIKAAGNVVLVCTADVSPFPEFSGVAAAVGERGLGTPDDANNVRGVVLRPDPSATCNENESDEPAFLEALRISTGIVDPLELNADAT